MDQTPALKSAFDLMHLPSQVRITREAPLPDGLLLLLRIAAGDDDVTLEAMRISGRPRQAVLDAAGFFIEQILLFSEADSYRVLGATPNASNEELRRNMAFLLRWLHPDMNSSRSVFAGRVTRAWNDLKTADRRAAYDQSMRASEAKRSLHRKKSTSRSHSGRSSRGVHSGARVGMSRSRSPQPGLLDRLLFLLLGRFVH